MGFISLFTWLSPLLAVFFLSLGTLFYGIFSFLRRKKPNVKGLGVVSAILLGAGMLCNMYVTYWLIYATICFIMEK